MPMPPMIINPLMIQIVLESAVDVGGGAIGVSVVCIEGAFGGASVGDGGAFDGGMASVVAFDVNVVVVESSACVLAGASSWDNSMMALAKNM